MMCGLSFICRQSREARGARCQGGQQSGAAGEVPLANTKFAGRLVNDWGETLPTNNRQAEVAMDWLMSQATRPDATAARHTDARSLAVPVPHSTMIPTRTPPGCAPFGSSSRSSGQAFLCALHHLRTTMAKVYALVQRVRIFFQKNWSHARRVPIARPNQTTAKTGLTASPNTGPNTDRRTCPDTNPLSLFRNRDLGRVH